MWDAAIRRVAQITGIRWSKWEQTVRSTMLQLGDSWPTDPALANILRDDGAVNLSLILLLVDSWPFSPPLCCTFFPNSF